MENTKTQKNEISENEISENVISENVISENEKTKNKVSKKKCNFCKKKLGIISFTCKCGKCFCQNHLNPHSHNCEFDYINEKKCKLIKENPKLTSKFVKI
tara:strand:+ start:743 stop:1042 length:300 start_codon:yes stop_codon:yes gene_type:complete